jgi:hypothetical protein
MKGTAIRRAVRFLLAALVLTGACGKDNPTSPTTGVAARSNEVFTGTIGVGGSQFYSFQVNNVGTTDVTLTSLRTPGSQTATVSTVVGLGLGTPQGTDCALASAITTAPALVKQITVTTNVQIYCVKIADVGNLRGALDYTVRILHP